MPRSAVSVSFPSDNARETWPFREKSERPIGKADLPSSWYIPHQQSAVSVTSMIKQRLV